MTQKPKIRASVRGKLRHFCRSEYEAKTGKPSFGDGVTIRYMASVLAGYPLGQKGAWRWLQENCPPLFVVPLAKSKTPRPRRPKSEPGVPFYQTEAWRWVRYEALKKSDGRCCLCGRPKRDNGVILHVDHIKPRSKFPHLELDVTNLQVLCEDCNLGKSNFDEIDWSAER